jgi:hypothetical protein
MCHRINSFNFAGEGIMIPTRREIDDTYLESNE